MERDDSSVIVADGLSIAQGGRAILSNISFSLGKGEFAYLIGRTGSGKTSLLKTLYADLLPASGQLTVTGVAMHAGKRSLNETARLRRHLGIIFQDFQLLPDRTVMANLDFVLRATGWQDRAARKTRIAEVMADVGLGAEAHKAPHQLSGGEQQRVCIARALLNEPQLLLADEPTGNLDPEVSLAIMELFHKLNRRGTAVLMATHNHGFLQSNPARTFVCKDGALVDEAPGYAH